MTQQRRLKKWLAWALAMLSLLLIMTVMTLAVMTGNPRPLAAQATEPSAPATATSAAATTAAGQTSDSNVQAAPSQVQVALTNNRTLAVSAAGQVQAAPDVAYLNVGADVQAPTAREALDKAKTTGESIRKAVLATGVDEKAIQTSGINAYPVNGTGKDGLPTNEPTRYRAYVNLTVTLSDLTKGGAALDAATKAGANQIGGLTYAIKDDSLLRAQALEQAVKQARPKAEAIARGLGVQVGQVLTVVEDPGGYYPAAGMAGKGDGGLAPGQLMVGVRVTVTYAML